MLKKIFGIAPKQEADGSYSPSKLALKLATVDTTDFENISYDKYKGTKSKILVIFTEQSKRFINPILPSRSSYAIVSQFPYLTRLINHGRSFTKAESETKYRRGTSPVLAISHRRMEHFWTIPSKILPAKQFTDNSFYILEVQIQSGKLTDRVCPGSYRTCQIRVLF